MKLILLMILSAAMPAFGGESLSLVPEVLRPSANSATSGATAVLADAASSNRGDPNQIRLTLYWENDGNFAKEFDSHDRHYTAGVGMSLTWRAPWVDRLLTNVPSIGGEFSQGADVAMGVVGTLDIYTPEDITTTVRQADRPFAGYLYGGIFAQRAKRAAPPEFGLPKPGQLLDPQSYSSFESLEFDLGMMGPSSLGQNAQEMIHHMIGDPVPSGWVNQIHDEPEFTLKYDRRWRSQAVRPFEKVPIAVQFIPELGITAGSLQDELRLGSFFRVGYNLPDDFGPGELSTPADFTEEAPCTCPGIFDNILRNQSIYVFARPYGRFVAHNALLQGDNWRHDDPVTATPTPAVFAGQAGIAWRIFKHFELAYMTTYESPEFHGQHGWDSWSSIQFSFAVAW
ncbi:MAG TPA: lipid A deacylase LpxR family protein [Phycisphaerae bacterium]|jgi:hypothetical protein